MFRVQRETPRSPPPMPRAIDCLVNVGLGDMKQPEYMVRVKYRLIPGIW